MSLTIERPLGLSEILAETVRLYGERISAVAGTGCLLAGAIVTARIAPIGVDLAIVALGLAGCYAAAARIAAGDSFVEAWSQVAMRVPVLLVLAVVVAVPLALALTDLILLVVVIAWIAFAGFSIPVAMLEQPEQEEWYGRVGYALFRSSSLARTEYLHAFGVAAALAIAWLLLGRLLAVALVGFAENGGFVAFLIVQGLLGPFFFLGLSVLYFEQKARALSSPREQRT
jgi:hypothetical protein